MEEQFYTIVLRHDTSTLWLVNDPILSLGEYGVEDDTHKVKRGDGESKWSELTYEDLFIEKYDKLILLIFFEESGYTWKLGKPFLKKYGFGFFSIHSHIEIPLLQI